MKRMTVKQKESLNELPEYIKDLRFLIYVIYDIDILENTEIKDYVNGLKENIEVFFKNTDLEKIIEHLKKNGAVVKEVEKPEDAGLIIKPNPVVDYDFCMNDDDYIDDDIDDDINYLDRLEKAIEGEDYYTDY